MKENSLVYIDTSVLVSVFFKEDVSSKYLNFFSKKYQLISSSLMLAEFYSVLNREKVEIAFSQDLLSYIQIINLIDDLDYYLKEVLDHGYLKGADLFHLAVAHQLSPYGEELFFLTADKQQARIATKLGFKVII
jgi:predicted nucleic acid-binding protein